MLRQDLVDHALRFKGVFDEACADDFPVFRVFAAEPPDGDACEIELLDEFKFGVKAAAGGKPDGAATLV